jgi:hypothetical protein
MLLEKELRMQSGLIAGYLSVGEPEAEYAFLFGIRGGMEYILHSLRTCV